MRNFETKDTEIGLDTVKDVDTTSRRVKVVISKMGNLDLDGDIIEKGAYTRTLNARGPKGVNLIYHLTDHNAAIKGSMIAKFSELYVQGDELIGVTDFPKTTHGNDMLELYSTKNITQHSVGFRIVKAEPAAVGTPEEHRLIKEIFLYEGSGVLWGANTETRTISVGKQLKSMAKEDMQKLFFATLQEINNFTKLLKDGTVSDDTFALVELGLIQKTDLLQTIFESTTQPATPAPDSGKNESLDVITAFTQNLILSNGTQSIRATA